MTNPFFKNYGPITIKDIYKVLFDAPFGLENYNIDFYRGEKKIGKLTSSIFSPKFNRYMGFVITKKENTLDKNNLFVKINKTYFKATLETFN